MSTMKVISMEQRLADTVGGSWQYDRTDGSWWSGDRKRHVCFVAACSCDDVCGHPPQLWMYGDGIPQHISQLELMESFE